VLLRIQQFCDATASGCSSSLKGFELLWLLYGERESTRLLWNVGRPLHNGTLSQARIPTVPVTLTSQGLKCADYEQSICQNGTVINEQCTYEFELGNQSCTDATRFRMPTRAVHCTYKYVQLGHQLPFCRKVGDFMNFQWTSSVAKNVMHWRIRTFLDVSAALLYTVHCNQANALISWKFWLYLRVCSTWSVVLTSTLKKNLYYVYETQTAGENRR